MTEFRNDAYIAVSPVMQDISAELKVMSRVPDCSILLLGETGVGKTYLIKSIHEWHFGNENNRNVVSVSAGQLMGGLSEGVLHGYEKGAFTGATKTQRGLLEIADGNTLLIDEVGDLPPNAQVMLLALLGNEAVSRRFGSEETRKPKPSIIISATNREINLEDSEFRRDLYYRIANHVVVIPPLRERPEDILAIAEYHLKGLNRNITLDDSARNTLLQYKWPGNIRELCATIDRSAALLRHDSNVLSSGNIIFQNQTRAGGTASGLTNIRAVHQEIPNESSQQMREAINLEGKNILKLLGEVVGYSIIPTDLAKRANTDRAKMAHILKPKETDRNQASLDVALSGKLRMTLIHVCDEHNAGPAQRKALMTALDRFVWAHEGLEIAKIRESNGPPAI